MAKALICAAIGVLLIVPSPVLGQERGAGSEVERPVGTVGVEAPPAETGTNPFVLGRMEALEGQNARLRVVTSRQLATIEALQARVDELVRSEAEAGVALAEAEAMREQLLGKDEQIARLREVLALGGFDQLRDQVLAQGVSIERLREQVERVRAERDEAQARAADAQAAVEHLVAALDRMESDLAALRGEAEEMNRSLADLRAGVRERDERIARLLEENEQLKERLN
ncbi:MAG: hypothetical protein AAF580_16355 [Pseudomonadota bacterium]